MNLANYNSKIYFISLSANTGFLNFQYKWSAVSWQAASGITIQGGYAYLSYYWSNSYLSVFSITNSSFNNYLFSPSVNINTIISDGTKIFFGGQSTNGIVLFVYVINNLNITIRL